MQHHCFQHHLSTNILELTRIFFSNVNSSLFAVSVSDSLIIFTRRKDKQIQLLTMTGTMWMCLWTLFFVPVELRKLCPRSVTSPIRIKDPDDCTKYHLCVDMREFIITCPDHYVVSERSMKCVPEGSVFDTCEQIYCRFIFEREELISA